MIDWMLQHWPELLGAAIALLSAINAWASKHPDDCGEGVKRYLLIALDVLSVLQSKGSVDTGSPRGLRLKLPLVQVSPQAKQ